MYKKSKEKIKGFSVSSKSMYTFELELPFATERHAEIVLNSVVQDEEPRSGSMVERFFSWSKTHFINKLIEN